MRSWVESVAVMATPPGHSECSTNPSSWGTLQLGPVGDTAYCRRSRASAPTSHPAAAAGACNARRLQLDTDLLVLDIQDGKVNLHAAERPDTAVELTHGNASAGLAPTTGPILRPLPRC